MFYGNKTLNASDVCQKKTYKSDLADLDFRAYRAGVDHRARALLLLTTKANYPVRIYGRETNG
jgi:predicted chitinase